MRIMIVGGGGREHALAWKLKNSPEVEEIYCVPGNAGIARIAHCLPGKDDDFPVLADIARGKQIDLTIVGPEAPLVEGITDYFRKHGLTILGPEKQAALLEGSKVWAKQFMRKWDIPTAEFEVFDSYADASSYVLEKNKPLVIKAEGLAAGKGVYVTGSAQEAQDSLQQIMVDKIYGEAGNRVVIEEKLKGEEASILAITDGENFWIMPSAQDHKPIGEGDTGPNTGGMGAYSPAPIMTEEITSHVRDYVFKPLLHGMNQEGLDYRGVIYAGLMITENGPKVLEFNVRFGDPEAQVILPRLESDLAPILLNAAIGKLKGEWEWINNAAVCVVMASGGYPGKYEKGMEISGLSDAEKEPGVFIFHAGTDEKEGKIVTSGGRVLGVTALASNLEEAVDTSYRAIEKINFNNAYYRRDIAFRALKR